MSASATYDEKKFIRAVIKLQRAYRLSSYVYRHFGPELFVDSGGGSSSGRILFEGVMDPAKWINVASSTSVPRLTRFMDHYWQMPKPEVLITVTGGAQDFQLSSQLQVAFDRGLVSAAQSAKAWIFTAGSDTGVMRLVGDAMHRFKVPLPVVGIFPWGVVNDRDQLLRTSTSTQSGLMAATYTGSKPTREGAPLNPHHTHFVFVDNGKRGGAAWGSEIELRSALEASIAKNKNIPIVQLVVQGGPGTLATVESTALAGKPIVVLVDSGGAATALHKYCTLGLDAVEPRFHAQKPKLESIKNLNDAYGGKQLLFFSLEGSTEGAGAGATLDMSSSLLEAIVKMLNAPSAYERLPVGANVVHPKRGPGQIIDILPDRRRVVRYEDGDMHRYTPHSLHKLMAGRPLVIDGKDVPLTGALTPRVPSEVDKDKGKKTDIMLVRTLELTVVWDRPELSRKILSGIQDEEPGQLPEVSYAMQRGFELHREHVIKLFLELPGMTMERIDMGQLYMRPDDLKFLSNNRPLQARLRMMVYEKTDPVKAKRPHALYQKALSRFFYSISPILRQELLAVDYTRPNDVFYWLTCHGNEQMARDVWPHCDNPVHAALLGATICKKMSQVISQGQAAAEERAKHMQEWAFGALEMAPDEKHAHDVLERSIRDDRVFTALDIALRTGAKNFLFQRHCVSLMDRLWRGDYAGSQVALPQDFSWTVLTLQTLFPFANRHLYQAQQQVKADRDAYGSTVFYDALGLAFSISAQERKKATNQNKEEEEQPAAEASSTQPRRNSNGSKRPSIASAHRHLDEIFKKRGQHPAENEKQDPSKTEESTLGSRVHAFYAVPAVKFIWRSITHLVGTVLYLLLIRDFKTPATTRMEDRTLDTLPYLHDLRATELLWIAYELGVWLDLRHQQMVRSHNHVQTRGGLEYVGLLSDALIIIAVGIRIAMEVRYYQDVEYDELRSLYEAYQVIISIKILVLGSGWMPFFSEYQRLGVLFIMVTEMVHDVVNWILLFSVMTVSFMLCLCGLQAAGMYTNEEPQDGVANFTEDELVENFDRVTAAAAIWSPLWSLFGEFDPSRYNWLAAVLMWTYCLFGSVVLVNLLVAAFADTYTRVKTASEMEYVYLRCTRLFEYKHIILAVPPLLMLNSPIVIRDMLQYTSSIKCVKQCLVSACFCFFRGRDTKRALSKHNQSSQGDDLFAASMPSASGEAKEMGNLTSSTCSAAGRMSMADGGLGAQRAQTSKARSKAQTSKPMPAGQATVVLGEMSVPSGMVSSTKLQRNSTTGELKAHQERSEGRSGADAPSKPKRVPTLFDGKLLAVHYLHEVRKKEADTVHALARTLRNELQHSMKQREAEFHRLATRVGGIENQLGAMDDMHESLTEIQGQLAQLTRATASTAASAVSAVPEPEPPAVADSSSSVPPGAAAETSERGNCFSEG